MIVTYSRFHRMMKVYIFRISFYYKFCQHLEEFSSLYFLQVALPYLFYLIAYLNAAIHDRIDEKTRPKINLSGPNHQFYERNLIWNQTPLLLDT